MKDRRQGKGGEEPFEERVSECGEGSQLHLLGLGRAVRGDEGGKGGRREGGRIPSARQRGDQTGTHLKEVHGVGALARGQQGGAAGERPRQGGAELGQVHGRAGRVDAEPGSVKARRGAGALGGGRARLESHRLHYIIWGGGGL